MSVSLIVLWALVGWCGNEPIRLRLPPRPDPPEPRPCLVCGIVLGAVAGIIGGWAYTQIFSAPDLNLKSGLFAATTSVGAYVAARVATDLYGLVSNR